MCFNRKFESEKTSVNEQIYKKWKEEWITDQPYKEKEEYFYPLFTETYDSVCSKLSKNRTMNIRVKKIYLGIVLLIPIGIIVMALLKNVKMFIDFLMSGDKSGWFGKLIEIFSLDMNFENVASYGIFLFIIVTFARIAVKWLDIKKYQETWVRHEDHKYRLDREMFKYVHELEPYNTSDKKLNFVENVLKIWDGNQQKFVTNMEDKEKELTDILEYMHK